MTSTLSAGPRRESYSSSFGVLPLGGHALNDGVILLAELYGKFMLCSMTTSTTGSRIAHKLIGVVKI